MLAHSRALSGFVIVDLEMAHFCGGFCGFVVSKVVRVGGGYQSPYLLPPYWRKVSILNVHAGR